MKQHLFLFILSLFLLQSGPQPVFAATTASPSATPSPTAAPKNQQIEDLKDRLATKVAELRKLERRAVYGTVKAKTISTLTVETETKDVKIELTDDIKIFQILKAKRTALTIDDVAKDDIVTIFGEYDTAVEVLKAKVIFIQNTVSIKRIIGTIKETNKTDYTLTVETKDATSYIVDFETFTKTSLWSAKDGLLKGGFSKLIPGDIVAVTGTAVPKKENRVSATRILNLGDLTGVLPTPSPTPASTPKTTGKATPTP